MGLISEQIRQDIQPYIKKVFKFLDEEKKNVKTRKALLEKIKDLMPYVGIPEGHEIFILELYSLNHRKDGDYSDLNKDNYIDPRERKGKVISNTKADLYTKALLPFRGSNLEGYWRKDYKGVDEYIVISYGWYPILVYKNDNWYKVTSNYSASTGRQVSNSTPKFGQNSAYLLTPTEMNDLVRGKSHEDIMKDKRKSLKKTEPELTKRARTISPSSWDRYVGRDLSNYKIKFKINRIEEGDNKAKIHIDIIDVMKRDPVSLKQLKTPENYTKGEIPDVTMDKVEQRIKRELVEKFRDYFGKIPYFWDSEDKKQIRDSENLEFVFNHLRK